MEYVIILLIVVNLILTVITLTKNINERNITDKISNLEKNTIQELSNFRSSLTKDLNDDFNKLSDRIENKMMAIDSKVNTRLDENLKINVKL